MNIYEVYWRYNNRKSHGYVRAESEENAREIAQVYLPPGIYVDEIFQVDESRITPQSITLNFPNMTDYELF